MKHFIRTVLPLAFSMALASCSVESADDTAEGLVDAAFNLVQEEFQETKGVVSASVTDNDIRSWIVAAYDSDGNLSAQSDGTDDLCSHIVLASGATYNLYFLVNCPGIEFPDSEDEVVDLVVGISSPEEMAMNGLPACSTLSGYVPRTSSVSVRLKRLVCSMKLTVSQTGLSTMTLKKVSVCNAPAGVHPFSSASYNKSLESFDYSSAELESLGFGGELTLYCLENLRGTITNSDPKKKVPDSMTDDQKEYATYLDVDADVTGRVEGNVHYRIYPGANTVSDFNLKRSYRYDIDLSLSCSELLRGCLSPYWKIDVSGVNSVSAMSRHWRDHGGYFWPSMNWKTDRLVIDNPFGNIKYTIISAEDAYMDEGTHEYGPYSPGGITTLQVGDSSFSFDFGDDYVDVVQNSEDEGFWWWIRATDTDDGSTVIAPVYQDGQSPLSLDFQADRTITDLYVGQSCSVQAVGPITDASKVQWFVEGDDEVVELSSESGALTNRIMCMSPGTVSVYAKYGEYISNPTRLTVKLPTLTIPGTLSLYEDGKDVQLVPRYRKADGSAIYQSDFDEALFDSLLRPLTFSWNSGSQPSIIESVHTEAESATYGNSYSDWSFHLTDIEEPGKIDRMTVTNPSGCSAVVDVVCRVPFSLTLPKSLGNLENYYYLQGDRLTGPLDVPYIILSTEAGDLENVTVTDGSDMFIYDFIRYGEGYRLQTIGMEESALTDRPDYCDDVEVHLYVRNRYSGNIYESPAVYTFSVRLHLAVVMYVYSLPWPSGAGKFWYMSPCWYMPKNCSVNPYGDISTEIIQWHKHNSEMHDTSVHCLEERKFNEYQIGDYSENLYRKHGIYSLTAYTYGQMLLTDFNDCDLEAWWQDDPSNNLYTGGYKSFKGGTLSLVDCPEIGRNIIIHDFTSSLSY